MYGFLNRSLKWWCWQPIFLKPKLSFVIFLKTLFIFTLLISLPLFAQDNDNQTGKITGVVVDDENGEPLIGANVVLDGTYLGAASDIDGTFVISDVPSGKYTLVISMLSYAETRVTNVEVKLGETTQIELSVKPEALTTEVVTVEARALENTEASLLKKRQLANSVSDAISSEAISRSGSDDAADAMTQVTGASVVDGKYVYIRGLGERYSSTMLNGAELPSADPEKKSVQMDLFPSQLLDNIVTLKTFTPDKPGSFSGGMVDVSTKSYPDMFMFKFAVSSSYNSEATFKNNYLTYPGGSTDWLGYDDGTRGIPRTLKEMGANIPTYNQARYNPELAKQLDAASKSFNPVMAPRTEKAPLNQSLNFSVGNQTLFLGRPLGYVGSLSWKRSRSFYQGGLTGRWQLGTAVAETDSLNPKIFMSDSRGDDLVNWGGMLTLASKLHNNHEFTANIFYTQSGGSVSRYLIGQWPEQFGTANAYFETRVLQYIERNLQSYQVVGEHYLPSVFGSKIDWKAAYNKTSQEEPDTRFFSNHFSIRPFNGGDTTIYSITPSNYSQPARYFRGLDENGLNLQMDMALPFTQWGSISGKIKLGGFYSKKDRDFEEVRYQYVRPATFRYEGDDQNFFQPDNAGIIDFDSTREEFIFGNYIEVAADPRGGSYTGSEEIPAGYAMLELPLNSRLRLVGGVRFESTRMNVASTDSISTRPDSLKFGRIDENDWLPSVNFVYQLSNNSNIRLAYGKTLARPTLREMAPYSNFEFINDYMFTGNVNLNRTLINNFDLRWEWFVRPGEIYAVSGFYKKFKDPIERTIIGTSSADNPEITYQNVNNGTVYGVEFELRKRLDFVSSLLNNFRVGTNLTLVKSIVDIPPDKLEKIIERDPQRTEFTEDTRPLQGQSPYLLNLDLGYDNYRTGTYANLHYNVFGDRLSEVTGDATPDVYEDSRGMLDFILTQRVYRTLNLKFAAKNLLDSSIRFFHEYKGVGYARKEYKLGRTFSFGLSYEM